ncbi:diguanylate cyclase [Deinococcus altitudinis]|uniref:GGDEF domain-containing protein n=1 Tax=Deinococcus altitudinis TaxID=468914 RepID=UPI003892A654
MTYFLNLLDQALLNFSILVGMVSLLGLTFPYRNDERPVHLVARWLLLAGASVLLLHHSITLSDGVRTDLRFLPVVLATVLGGPVYGLSVSVPMVIYRVGLGGAGVWPSYVSLVLTVLVTLLISRRRNQFQLSPWELLKSGTLISLAGNLPYLLLPGTLGVFLTTIPVKAASLLVVFVLLQTRFRLVGSFQDYRRMAFTDKLTGLNNRRQFDEDLKPGQAEPPAFLLLLDIDHFKTVNDRFGHEFGDKVLEQTAQLLRENLRHWDGAYRYGGEEFAVLLRHCTTQQAHMVAERVRGSIERQMVQRLDCLVTVSIGAVSLPGRIQPGVSLRQADDALYTAKKTGRNQVVWEETRATGAEPA